MSSEHIDSSFRRRLLHKTVRHSQPRTNERVLNEIMYASRIPWTKQPKTKSEKRTRNSLSWLNRWTIKKVNRMWIHNRHHTDMLDLICDDYEIIKARKIFRFRALSAFETLLILLPYFVSIRWLITTPAFSLFLTDFSLFFLRTYIFRFLIKPIYFSLD